MHKNQYHQYRRSFLKFQQLLDIEQTTKLIIFSVKFIDSGLFIPIFGDQMRNAGMMERSGVGKVGK